MFPPVRTESLNDSLKGLWESMQGCCDYLSGSGNIEEPKPGHLTVTMGLLTTPTPTGRRALTEYTRLYLRECGWSVRGITVEGGVMRIKLTPRR